MEGIAAEGPLPSVTVITPAFNEEQVLPRKIGNLLALSYPREKLAIRLILDGCTDNSAAIALNAAEKSGRSEFQVIALPSNVGKVAILNQQIAACASDIVVLTDASAIVPADALLRAAQRFADPSIGVVCASYGFDSEAETGEQVYWDYQRQIKVAEAMLGAPIGAHGAFYCFRRALWEPLPRGTINDDFVLPMRIVAKGYAALYDRELRVLELEPATPRQDFRRRIRLGAGNLQQVFLVASLLDPRKGWTGFSFLSGKALRAFMPFVLVVGAASLVALAIGSPPYLAFLACCLAGIAAAQIGCVLGSEWARRFARQIRYMMLGYVAALIGCLIFLSGRSPERLWARTE